MQEFDILDVFSEKNCLNNADNVRMKEIKVELDSLWVQEETKAWQRSRDRKIVEGDRNTAYFHALANQRKRKKTLAILDGPDGTVESTEEMLQIASTFYKNLFAKETRSDFSLGDDFWDEADLLNDEEIALLDSPFYEEESMPL
jgi:hypothetical protein